MTAVMGGFIPLHSSARPVMIGDTRARWNRNVNLKKLNRAVLLDAMRDITLDSAELNVVYSRK
jgi:hypothetical protein